MKTSSLLAIVVAAGCTSGLPPDDATPDLAPPLDFGSAQCALAKSPPSNDAGVPSFGDSPVQTKTPPPPVSGGTLLATRDGKTIVAADPDRDVIWLVDVAQRTLRATVTLQPGEEPGRVADDGAGRVHVALRRGGALVTVDAQGNLLARRPVCPSPRGVAYDPSGDLVHVACAGGELVSLPAAGGAPTRTLWLDRDLRDVVVDGSRLLVSRFRAAELLVVAADGTIAGRLAPPESFDKTVRAGAPFTPAVAWRTIANPSGGAFMLHQRGQASPIALGELGPIDAGVPIDLGVPMNGGSPYGGGACNSVVHAAFTPLAVGGAAVTSPALPIGALPVDVAVDQNVTWFVAAGEAHRSPSASLVGLVGPLVGGGCGAVKQISVPVAGGAVAVALVPGAVVVQTREPATLQLFASSNQQLLATVALGGASVEDTGHAIFHSDSGSGLACASCHPEGGEDGRTWQFDIGPRRTQSLRGGITGRAPLHWSGDLPDLDHLFSEVFVRRMSGPPIACDQLEALQRWIDSIPHLPSPANLDVAAVARGAALFSDPSVGCTTCHSGKLFTDNAHVDVGTGAAFQVPSLRGVAWRAPYLHNGCAATLHDRFGSCGGTQHGSTSQLTAGQIDDLVAYLQSL